MEHVIDQIYEVPLTPGGWMSLSATLEGLFSAPFAIFIAHPDKVVPVGACGPLDEPVVDLYAHHLWRDDPAIVALKTAPTGTIVTDSQLITQRERATSRLYSDVFAPNGLELGMYASVAQGRGSQMIVSPRRPAKAGDFDLHEIDLMKRILPHLRRSFRTWQRMAEVEIERQAAMDAIEHVTVGIALVDKAGKLHFANRIAEEQIRQGALNISNGRVTARSPAGARELQQAIGSAARSKRPVAGRLALPSNDGAGSSVLVSPVADGVFEGLHADNLAMLMIGGQEQNAVEEAAVSRAYGLTPAEARLLAALVEGERVPDYARRHGIAVATAKTHLQALFDKVGERRQADLIRRAVSDPTLRVRTTS